VRATSSIASTSPLFRSGTCLKLSVLCWSVVGDAGLVGVLAQLATVGDEQLARILSTQYAGQLSCCVVADKAAYRRLVDGLRGPDPHVPNFAILTHMQPYRCAIRGRPCTAYERKLSDCTPTRRLGCRL